MTGFSTSVPSASRTVIVSVWTAIPLYFLT
jgi:hypothetical protein